MEEDNALANASNESQKAVKSYFTETRINTHEWVYTWKIKNLSHSYLKKSDFIASSTFTTEIEDLVTLEWYLSFYPSGKEDLDEDYATLILGQVELNSYPEEMPTVYFKWSIVFENDGCCQEETRHENYVTFSEDLEDYVIEDFLKKSDVHRFLHNGNLKIRCRVYSYTGVVESDVSSTPITRMENQTDLDHRVHELEDFGKLFENKKFSDVTLVVGEEKFLAHKNVLSARCRVFEAMFEHNMKENQENLVTIVDVDSKVMKEVLRFIYSAEVNNLKNLTPGLLAAADKYELIGLKRMCEDALIEQLSDKTVGEILLLSDRHDAEKLRTATLEFITIHANELASVDSFNEAIKSLSPSLVATVIKSLMLKM